MDVDSNDRSSLTMWMPAYGIRDAEVSTAVPRIAPRSALTKQHRGAQGRAQFGYTDKNEKDPAATELAQPKAPAGFHGLL